MQCGRHICSGAHANSVECMYDSGHRHIVYCIELILGIYVTGIEIGFQNLQDGSCIAVKGDRLGMLMDAQGCWHDSTVHAQSFSHLKGRADDCDIIR